MKILQQVVKAKLVVTPLAAEELKTTMKEFAKACNLIANEAFARKLHRRYDLHHITYTAVRKQTNLPSQHVINAIAKVSQAFTRERNRHRFKQSSSVRYDSRTLALKRDFHEATLTICPKGRVSVELQMPVAMRQKLRIWNIGSAELVRRNGNFYLHIAVSTEAPEPSKPSGSLGVDLGVKRLAVTSSGRFHAAKKARHQKKRFQTTRSDLQANGSRRAKRVLMRVSGREHRYMSDVNHCLSKKIATEAQAGGQRVVLEDLTGIRGRVARFMHKHLHGWSFGQLRSFIEYKAAAVGVECVTVDPRFTSVGCSRCLHIGSRPNQSTFTCEHCGMRSNADLNAARGIAKRHDLLATGRYFCPYPLDMPTAPQVAPVLLRQRQAVIV